MAKLITITTKNLWDDWIFDNKDDKSQFYTQQEIDDVLTPYYNYILSLPGIIPEGFKSDIGTTQSVTVRQFDTLEHAQQALLKISGRLPDTDPIVLARNALVKQKMQAVGADYTVTYKIV